MRLAAVIVSFLVWFPSAQAIEYKYSLGGGVGIARLTGGDFFNYDTESSIGFTLGHRLSDRWWFNLEYSGYSFTNKTNLDSSGSVLNIANNSPLEFRASRLGATITRSLFAPDRLLNLTAGAGGGLMVWKAVHPDSNTVYEVRGEKNEAADFSASELFLAASVGIRIRPASRWSLHLFTRADYLTGAGAEFDSSVKSVRDCWLLGSMVRLNFHFSRTERRTEWKSDEAWAERPTDRPLRSGSVRDSDADGVPDHKDQCLNTPSGVVVDGAGCPIDSDRDGVADGRDDCPGTGIEARATVDIHGCPVDSDFDGIPDYTDACPYGAVGAMVDEYGCPIDSDKDGVADGLDDCPFTLVGVDVDKFGCIELSMFSKPMVLNIDYPSGSFEIDPHSRERIKKLANVLSFVKDIKLEINGYTDNIGTLGANRKLSEKRAHRVRNYLVSLGVEEERMKVFGRGETNFVASNQTAEGRARNRRIEIVFYY